jgi:hypothetical protein
MSRSEGLDSVLILLTPKEADELSVALRRRLDKQEGFRSPGWHCHIEDADGNELTVGVSDEDD